MAIPKKQKDYQVDGRVSIALDALDEKQREAVDHVIADRAHFLATASDRRNVRSLSKNEPLYTLKVPSGLRIIYSQVGEKIIVMDLVRQATLDHYARKTLSTKTKSTTKKKIKIRQGSTSNVDPKKAKS